MESPRFFACMHLDLCFSFKNDLTIVQHRLILQTVHISNNATDLIRFEMISGQAPAPTPTPVLTAALAALVAIAPFLAQQEFFSASRV